MSSYIWDIAQSTLQTGYELNLFLYEGKVKNKVPKPHTEEEYREILERIRERCFREYDEVAYGLGWKDDTRIDNSDWEPDR